MKNSIYLKTLLVLAGLIVAFGLFGCGNSGSPGSSGGTGKTPAAGGGETPKPPASACSSASLIDAKSAVEAAEWGHYWYRHCASTAANADAEFDREMAGWR